MTALKPEIFEGAANLLEAHGLAKGVFCNGDRRCVMGAIYEVVARDTDQPAWLAQECPEEDCNCMNDPADPQPSRAVARDAEPYVTRLEAMLSPRHGYYALYEWNDKPSRRRGQVVALLRKAAEEVRR